MGFAGDLALIEYSAESVNPWRIRRVSMYPWPTQTIQLIEQAARTSIAQ